MIYFDNAATTFPKPECVIKAMEKAQRFAANPGRGGNKLSVAAGKIVFDARQKVADFFGTQVENVVFTKNCTESLNTAIKGVLSKGDHVVISSLEHNSVLRPLERLKSEGIIGYDVAFVDPLNDEKTVENFKKLINPKTKLIVCTHASNVFGTVLPIEKIGNAAKKYGAVFVVDAAQSAGTININLNNSSIDILCLPGHKGLFGPLGTGVMIVNSSIELRSLIEGGTGSLSLEKRQPKIMPDKFESGTLNLLGIAGISSGIDFINRNGRAKIFEHENELIKLLENNLKDEKNIKIYDNMHSKIHAPVLSLNLKNKHSEEVAQALDDLNIAVRAGYHCSYLAHNIYGTVESGTVRISPGYFNTKKDVNYLSFCLKKISND